MKNLKIKLTINELEYILNKAKMIKENNDSYSNTIVIEKLAEVDNHLGNDIGVAWIKSNYSECNDGRITNFID